MAHGKGTAHHKLHGLVGWGLIIGLPFAIGSAVGAIGGGADGFKAWLSTPLVFRRWGALIWLIGEPSSCANRMGYDGLRGHKTRIYGSLKNGTEKRL